jgi:hypothetical protein
MSEVFESQDDGRDLEVRTFELGPFTFDGPVTKTLEPDKAAQEFETMMNGVKAELREKQTEFFENKAAQWISEQAIELSECPCDPRRRHERLEQKVAVV